MLKEKISLVLVHVNCQSSLYNIKHFFFCQVLVQHPSNLYAANGAGVVLAEKGHYDVAKELLTQVS